MTDWLEFHQEQIKLHSDSLTNWLVRGDLIFEDKALRALILDYWAVALFAEHVEEPEPWGIYGIPTGGTRWAKAFAEWVDRPFVAEHIITRDAWPEGGSLFVVDDVITTGTSLREVSPATARFAVVNRLPAIEQLDDPPLYAWAHIYLPRYLIHSK